MAVFAHQLTSVGAARHWLGEFLGGIGVRPAARNDAELLISELVTNALRHGQGEIVARSSIGDGGEIRVSVTDSGGELPAILPIDPDRVGGVGLHVVDRLAFQWGVAPFPGGKTVWAILPSGPPR